MMLSNHLILCHPLFLLLSIFPSIRIFYNEGALCIRWWSIGASASASVLPVNIQGWFSFRIDWFDLQLGSHSFLQGIFQTQGLNLGLLHCSYILYCLSHQGSLMIYPMYMWKNISFVHSPIDNHFGCFHAWLLWIMLQWTWKCADISCR